MSVAAASASERTLDFSGATDTIEAKLVHALELGPRVLAPELSALTGSYKGQPVHLTARAYSGPRIRYARFVRIAGGGLDIGNVLCLAEPEYPLPMFGADLVSLARVTAMVVADLSPVPGSPPVEALLAPYADRLAAGELPDWARRWFSPQPLFTRVDNESRDAAIAGLLGYARAFADLTTTATPAPERSAEVERWQHDYCAAHREEDRGLMLLSKLFERELALRFLREVLFPALSLERVLP